jgi:hypothetical protein
MVPNRCPAQKNEPMIASPQRTFAVVEFLLLPSLLVLVAALLWPVIGGLLLRAGNRSVEEQVADILQQARRDAIVTGREVALRFEGEEQRFVWSSGEFVRLSGPRTAIGFFRPADHGAVPALTFFPDGSCDRVGVDLQPASGAGRQWAIDPRTGTPDAEPAP